MQLGAPLRKARQAKGVAHVYNQPAQRPGPPWQRGAKRAIVQSAGILKTIESIAVQYVPNQGPTGGSCDMTNKPSGRSCIRFTFCTAVLRLKFLPSNLCF